MPPRMICFGLLMALVLRAALLNFEACVRAFTRLRIAISYNKPGRLSTAPIMPRGGRWDHLPLDSDGPIDTANCFSRCLSRQLLHLAGLGSGVCASPGPIGASSSAGRAWASAVPRSAPGGRLPTPGVPVGAGVLRSPPSRTPPRMRVLQSARYSRAGVTLPFSSSTVARTQISKWCGAWAMTFMSPALTWVATAASTWLSPGAQKGCMK
jgi:hypothetical protein